MSPLKVLTSSGEVKLNFGTHKKYSDKSFFAKVSWLRLKELYHLNRSICMRKWWRKRPLHISVKISNFSYFKWLTQASVDLVIHNSSSPGSSVDGATGHLRIHIPTLHGSSLLLGCQHHVPFKQVGVPNVFCLLEKNYIVIFCFVSWTGISAMKEIPGLAIKLF